MDLQGGLRETKLLKTKNSASKPHGDGENVRKMINKLGLSWAKLSQSWGLKLGFVFEVGDQSMKLKFEDDF